MAFFRSPEIQQKYDDYRKTPRFFAGCSLCKDAPLKKFKYWKIIKNNFPYDLIASTHDMIVPLRHIREDKMTEEEWEELEEIKKGYIGNTYEFIIEPVMKNKSIPDHFHLHLVVTK